MGRQHGLDDLGDPDVAQDVKERHRRDRNDGDAQQEADPVPAELFVAEPRRFSQRVEHRLAPAR
jgi:hypothetical protein